MPLLMLGMLRAIWSLRREPQFVSLALLTVIAIASGTGFYSLVEGLRFVDALYFSVVTLTTVGYGDFAPETDVGKLFTAVYVLVGIGILLSLVTTLAAKMSQTSPLHPFTSPPARRDGDPAAAAATRAEPRSARFWPNQMEQSWNGRAGTASSDFSTGKRRRAALQWIEHQRPETASTSQKTPP